MATAAARVHLGRFIAREQQRAARMSPAPWLIPLAVVKFSALYAPTREFLRRSAGKDVLVVAMERHAADHIVRGFGGSHSGIHRYSLRQLIAALANPVL